MKDSAVVVVNPKAGATDPRKIGRDVQAALNASGCWKVLQLVETNYNTGDDEVKLAKYWGPRVKLIAAVAGDGTVSKLVRALDETDRNRLAMGFIPVGNANVLAREVGIAWNNPREATHQLIHGQSAKMDVGTLEGVPRFLLMLDVGYLSDVVASVSDGRKKAVGHWVYKKLGGDLLYTWHGIAMLSRRSPSFSMAVKGAPSEVLLENLNALNISNVSVYAKHWSFAPAATATDGLLDYNALPRSASLLRWLWTGVRWKPNPLVSRFGTGTQFLIRANGPPIHYQVDGDPGGRVQELLVGVSPKFYSLIVPGANCRRRKPMPRWM